MLRSLLMKSVELRARTFLQLTQLFVATPVSCDAIVHSTCCISSSLRSDGRYVLLQVDLGNEFNLVSRRAFLRKFHTSFSDLYRWFFLCYDTYSPTIWFGIRQFQSSDGTQQEHPLGPLLFSLDLHKPLTSLQDHINTFFPDPTEIPLCSFYLEEGVLISLHEVLAEALSFLNSDYVRSFGRHLAPTKCKL